MEAIIAGGLSVGILLVGGEILNTFETQTQRQANMGWLAGVKNEATLAITNPRSWRATLNRPENAVSMACVRNKTDCTGGNGPMVMVTKDAEEDGNDKLLSAIADPGNPLQGLTSDGKPCNEFRDIGNDKCPFRFNATWRAICNSSPCLDPDIEVTVQLLHKPDPNSLKPLLVNVKNFGFTVKRGQAFSALGEICTSVGGVFDVGTQQCTMPFAGECPPDQFLIGFTSAHLKICTPFVAGKCTDGQIVTDMLGNGTYVCGPGCADMGSGTFSYFP